MAPVSHPDLLLPRLTPRLSQAHHQGAKHGLARRLVTFPRVCQAALLLAEPRDFLGEQLVFGSSRTGLWLCVEATGSRHWGPGMGRAATTHSGRQRTGLDFRGTALSCNDCRVDWKPGPLGPSGSARPQLFPKSGLEVRDGTHR